MEPISKLIEERFKQNSFTSRQQLLMARGFYWGKHIALVDNGAEEDKIVECLKRFKELSHKVRRCQIYLTSKHGVCLNCSNCPNDYKLPTKAYHANSQENW